MVATVVTRYSAGYPNPNNLSAYSCNGHENRSKLFASFFNIAATVDDTTGSVYWLARIPSGAMIKPALSSLVSTGIAGLTGLEIGLTDGAGTSVDNALMAATDVHSAASYSPFGAVTGANLAKRLWAILGLASDPRKDLNIYAKITAGPVTGAGVLIGDLIWTLRGE